jgi:uncharacterized protein (DUF2384 family)
MSKGMREASQAALQRRPTAPDDKVFNVAAKAAARVAAAWGMTNAEAAALVGMSERTWSRIKAGGWTARQDKDQLMRVSGIVGVYKGLHLYFSDALADRWPKLANSGPPFMNRSPVDYMKAGGLPAILETRGYVDALRGGM